MKVMIDVLGASKGSGGPYLHAHEFVLTWIEDHPEDEIIIVGPRSFVSDAPNVRRVIWPNGSMPARIVGQMLIVPLAARLHRSAKLLVSLPVISPLAPKQRSYCFAHDWRHLTNPSEFGRVRKIYRRTWSSSIPRARAVFCVSHKAIEETHALFPSADLILAPNGNDHPRRWAAGGPPVAARSILTFGHRNNKRPELVIRALAELQKTGLDSSVRLVVLGAEGAYRDELSNLAARLGVKDSCDFPGFVPDEVLADFYRASAAIVLASTDEGFGLPVAEAIYLGLPAVVTTDSGMFAIFGDDVTSASPDPESIAAELRGVLSTERGHGKVLTTWAETVEIVRNGLSA